MDSNKKEYMNLSVYGIIPKQMATTVLLLPADLKFHCGIADSLHCLCTKFAQQRVVHNDSCNGRVYASLSSACASVVWLMQKRLL